MRADPFSVTDTWYSLHSTWVLMNQTQSLQVTQRFNQKLTPTLLKSCLKEKVSTSKWRSSTSELALSSLLLHLVLKTVERLHPSEAAGSDPGFYWTSMVYRQKKKVLFVVPPPSTFDLWVCQSVNYRWWRGSYTAHTNTQCLVSVFDTCSNELITKTCVWHVSNQNISGSQPNWTQFTAKVNSSVRSVHIRWWLHD